MKYLISCFKKEPGQLSRYNDWLQAGRQEGSEFESGKVKNFLFSTSSRPALGPTQPPFQRVLGAPSPGVKRLGRLSSGLFPSGFPINILYAFLFSPLVTYTCDNIK
jgi:hypothetical protein